MSKPFLSRLGGLLLNMVLAGLMLVLSLFLADQVLYRLGLPAPAQLNPPNFKEERKNIEFQYEFKTNSLGFRYKDIPLRKPKGTQRIFLVGDSFTEGWGLAADERFSAILEERYSRPEHEINFINGGLAGAGPVEYGDIFLKVGMKYRPDGLLICLYGNDLSDTWPPARANPLKRLFFRIFPNLGESWMRFKDRVKARPKHEVSHDMVESTISEARRRGIDEKQIEEWRAHLPMDLVAATDRGDFAAGTLSSGLLYPNRFTDSLDIDTAAAEAKWRYVVEILDRVVGECRRRHIQVAFAFFPLEFQYAPSFHRPDDPWIASGTKVRREWLSGDTELQRRCQAWAKEKGLPFIDLTSALRKSIDEGHILNFNLDGHWNPEGARTVAAILSDWIDQGHIFSFISPGNDSRQNR